MLELGQVKEREAYEALGLASMVQTGSRTGWRDGICRMAFGSYDVSSSYFEGRRRPLAHHGHSRDHRGDRLQIVYGLLCTRAGR